MDIVKENIERMRSKKLGGLQYAIVHQAAFSAEFEGLSATIVSYFYDSNGKMVFIGNSREAFNMREFYRSNLQIVMRDADSIGPLTRIVEFEPSENAPEIAQSNLQKTIDEYNDRYCF